MHPQHRRLLQILLDLALLCSVGLVPLITKLNAFTPYKRGFFCDDETIQHPYHPGTVPSAVLALVSLFLPLFVMVVIECILAQQGHPDTHEPLTLGRCTVNACLVAVVARYAVFLFGLGATQTFTDITKYTIGRLRPHFIAVCQPNYALFNCSKGYIETDVCTGDPELIKKARLSFLSGHTSIASYAALYTAMYLQARMVWEFSRLLKHVLQVLVVLMGWLCALSRISDYKHHPEDVITGAMLGIATCLVVVMCISDLPPAPIARAIQYRVPPSRKISRNSNLPSDYGSSTRDVELAS